MSASVPALHRILPATPTGAPAPFRGFAVRSDEAMHAYDARAPWPFVHVLATPFLDAASLASLAALGWPRVDVEAFGDVDYATVTLPELAVAAPAVADLPGRLAGTLRATGVLGDDPAAWRRSVETRIDFLATRGAGFHNDVANHWSRCLFWILALEAADVEFVMPHAGVRVAVAPGDLLVFDQTMAHGLCRPRDGGQAVAASFESGVGDRQIFLTGELPLSDAHWAALGVPWGPVEAHDAAGALDLMVAEFDDRSGAVKRPAALRACMKRTTCHVDAA